MARLDRFIQVMHEQRADALQLAVGQPAALVTNGATRAITRDPLSDGQIVGLVKEIAGADTAGQVGGGAPVSFGYHSPSGEVQVELTPGADGTRATVRPSRAGGAPAAAAKGPDLAEARGAIEALLRLLVEAEASDLHLRSGEPPMLRRHGELVREPLAAIPAERLEILLLGIMSSKEINEFRDVSDTDWAYEIAGLARFRCNAGRDRHGPFAVFRVIPTTVRTADEMGLTREVQNLCYLTKGLVVVTGPTGSGKSTTLAALVDLINRTRTDHIITIEDPIEFVHPSKKCLVTQRQIGVHTRSFKQALRAALREDPDIILVGEMRDLETVSIAIETAETGHLVFGTLHTTTAASTVDRIIDQFPADRQSQVRVMLSESLRGVIAQTLCKKIGGGRVAAREILLSIPAVSNLIREGKTFQIPSIMQTNRKVGMVTLNDALDGAGGSEGSGAEGGLHEGGGQGRIRRGAEGEAARYLVPWRGVTVAGAAPILVLVNPQDIVNIASAVRIARNFGVERMRLVNPESFDPWRIEGIAHNSAEFVARIEIVDTLEAAIQDCVHVALLTARGRTAKRRTLRPREAAVELVGAERGGAGRLRGRTGGSGPHQRRAGSGARAGDHPDRSPELLAQPGAGGGDHGLRVVAGPRRRRRAAQASSQGHRAGHVGPDGRPVRRLAAGALGGGLLQDQAVGERDAVVP